MSGILLTADLVPWQSVARSVVWGGDGSAGALWWGHSLRDAALALLSPQLGGWRPGEGALA